MNKSEIKQIILEEIEAALQEMNENMSPEDMAADSRPEEGDEIEGPGYEDMPGAKVTPFVTDLEARIARAMETGDEDELEDLAAGELDRAGLEEMARTANVFALAKEASIKDVLQFMQRVNDVLKTYKSPGQKRPKKRFTPEEMKALAKVMLQDGGFTSKDIIAATSYNSPAQANKFLAALEQKGLIKLTSQLKKSIEPERDPNAPETRGRKAKSAEFDVPDDALDMDFGDFEDLDLGDINALEENNNTMTNLEKYIRQQIKEAKNPLAKKMKEIENQGRIAALETKLAAIAEMIEETNGRLTRIDEDNEFADMMDKNAVKEVRKQLKELERAQAKLQKEYDKAAGGRKKKEVVDEDLPVAEDAIDVAMDEIELEEDNFALNEAIKSSKSYGANEAGDLELKSMAKKIFSYLKSDGYKVSYKDGLRSLNDFSKHAEKGKFAIVSFIPASPDISSVFDKPYIKVYWRPAEFGDKDLSDLSKRKGFTNDMVSKIRKAIPENLKDVKIETSGGDAIEGSMAISIFPQKGSNLSESVLRMQKLAGLKG